MKSFVLFICVCLSIPALARDPKREPPYYAYLIQTIDSLAQNKEILGQGPMASVTAMAALGFVVTDISFDHDDEYSCLVHIKMGSSDGKSEQYDFTFSKIKLELKSSHYIYVANECSRNAKWAVEHDSSKP